MAGRKDDDDRPDGPAADGGLPAGASGAGGAGAGYADADFDYDDVGYGGYGDYADGGDDDGSDDDYADEGDGDGSGDADDDDSDDADDGRAPWYSWERWKYIGGGIFLVLSVSGVGYVIWDIVDLLPKPVTIELIRAALRESPGRITDVLALAGMISFGPPAGVDLMFGATKAANQWVRQQKKKDIAKGRTMERKEQHIAMRKRLSKFAGQGMTPEEVQQVIAELSEGGGRDGQK